MCAGKVFEPVINWHKTAAVAVSGFCIGFFMSARLQAFLLQAWNIGLSRFFVWEVALVFLVMSLILHSSINKIWTSVATRTQSTVVIALLSFMFCLILKRIVVDRAVLGSSIETGFISDTVMIIGASLLLTLFLIILYRGLDEIGAKIKQWAKALTLMDLIFAVGVLFVLNIFSVIYMKNSSTIYFWDNAGYWANAQVLTNFSKSGILTTISTVYESILTADYNYLIVLPFVPIIRAFGPSRLVFVLAIVNLYLFPLLLLIYGIAKRSTKHAFTAAICTSCSLPMLFYLSLLGFVDVAGVFFALAAMELCVNSVGSLEQPYLKYVFSGCFLAVAVLLRRWYVLFALSLVLSQFVTYIVYKKNVTRFLWLVGTFAFVLIFFFQPMVSGILLADSVSAYSAYSMDIKNDFMLIFRYFGLFTLLLSLFSFFLFLRKKQYQHKAVLVLSQAVLCFILFTHIQTHGQQHLLLYVPAAIMALISFYALLLEYASHHKIALIAVFLSALLPLLSPFVPRMQPKSISEIRYASVLPSFSYYPPTRSDAREIVNLVRYLDETIGEHGKTVGVLASSFILNDDILKEAEASLNLPRVSNVSRDYISGLPAVDSRDSFPGSLFDCDYLLVASPIQLHLGETNQYVVAIPASEVINSTGFGAAYKPMNKTFYVGDGSIMVRLYEKVRTISASEKIALISAVETAVKGH